MKEMTTEEFFAPIGTELSTVDMMRSNTDAAGVRYSEAAMIKEPCELSDEEHDALCRIFLSGTHDIKPGRNLQ